MNSSISLCIRNKNFISSKTADLPQKYERNFNPVYVCVCIFLIPASISHLPFHLKIFGRLNFVFTDDMHISAYSDSREIDFSSLGAARSSSQRRLKIFDLSTKDFVFTKFFSLIISSESFEQLGQSNFTQLRGITFQFFLILER